MDEEEVPGARPGSGYTIPVVVSRGQGALILQSRLSGVTSRVPRRVGISLRDKRIEWSQSMQQVMHCWVSAGFAHCGVVSHG